MTDNDLQIVLRNVRAAGPVLYDALETLLAEATANDGVIKHFSDEALERARKALQKAKGDFLQ